MKLNIKFLVILGILVLAIVFGAKAFQNTGKLSADTEKQSKALEQLSQ